MKKIYTCIVKGYDSGLNELLNAQRMIYDKRTHKTRVFNDEKRKNDRLCESAIKSQLKGVHFDKPISMDYRFYLANKKRDRSNSMSAFIKSFEDALQHCKVITNDTYDLVLTPTVYFEIDKNDPRVEVIIKTE